MDPTTKDELIAQATALANSITKVEEELTPFLSNHSETLDSTLSGLDPIDRARSYILLSYAINTLMFTYLRTEGATKGHPVRRELMRIKDYMDKVAKAAGLDKPNMRVDQPAAKRFIRHGINLPERKQRKELASSPRNFPLTTDKKKPKIQTAQPEPEAEAEDFLSKVIPEVATSETQLPSTPASQTSSPKVGNALAKGGKKRRKEDKSPVEKTVKKGKSGKE
ncbi:hypothetical protein HDU67_006323 [Dinochytrium kinnereticum]|nr:hypothetical protein HDU67_006323 [Dinochytrium kinnereticum]